jgi:Domain of unknown function (DUF4136)
MKKMLLLPLALMAFFISCGPTVRVFSDYDKDVNITAFKTYAWLDAKAIEGKGINPIYYNELNDKRIKTAINTEMTARGYRLLDNNAELELHYHIVVEDKTTVTNEPWSYNFSPYWINRRVNVYQYREGTLIVDMMDKKTNMLVWRGWATDVITQSAAKDPQTAITKAVQAIYKKYPYTVI